MPVSDLFRGSKECHFGAPATKLSWLASLSQASLRVVPILAARVPNERSKVLSCYS